MPEGTRKDVESKIEDVRQAMDGSDNDRIGRTTEALAMAIQQIGASMYESGPAAGSGSDGAGPGAGAGEPTDEDVIEGDFTES